MTTHYLSTRQVEQLLAPINPARVEDLRGMSYVAQHDVRAHMNRIFGFGRWSTQVIQSEPIFEQETKTKSGTPAWIAAYRVTVRVEISAPDGTVLATYEDCHVSGNAPQPDRAEAHALALTSAVSTAFKRACTNLGDQFGLSLYEKGSKAAIVKGVLVRPDLDDVQSLNVETALVEEEVSDGSSTVPEFPELAQRLLEALYDIKDKHGDDASARILAIAGLKAKVMASNPDLMLTMVPVLGVSLGVVADQIAAGATS